MAYDHRSIERKWRAKWKEQGTYKVDEAPERPKYYVLDMFPYPSGAGLHVGHPLGYIASDIVARFKRAEGYNVLHPMGFDAFGLPAEQYAIQTGQHPADTTEKNVQKYREQLERIGFSFDWSRQVRTSDPSYYRWTQWIFKQFFQSWYNNESERAEPIESLIEHFENGGSALVDAPHDPHEPFSAEEWKGMSESEQQKVLLHYRLAYLSDQWVNWCPALGTVLANEEVQDGVSERGGHPVERKLMKQWSLRITAYADRLLEDLDRIDWPEALKEQQRHWIGRSEGARIRFPIIGEEKTLEVFTTRPDTIYGVSFMVLAPEHEWAVEIASEERKKKVDTCVDEACRRTERERQMEGGAPSGVFTGAYAVHPFTDEALPIYIGDYVLASYGSGAVMAVPGSDERDFRFAKHFELPILPVIEGTDIKEGPNDDPEGILMNSDFLNGMKVPEAIRAVCDRLEEEGKGERQVNYRLRDAIFSRQRYWGEPFPIYYVKDEDGHELPYPLSDESLPLELPEVDEFKPTSEGEPPLARAQDWKTKEGHRLEYNTMPGWAGSSWYFLRYMDPENEERFVSPEKVDYWQNVDLYIGGSEHATGHLLYARFWTKFLFDHGWIPFEEPFQKLLNQGMIVGTSYRVFISDKQRTAISAGLVNNEDQSALRENGIDPSELRQTFAHIDLISNENELDVAGFKEWCPEYKDHEFIFETDGRFRCHTEMDKMSKSRFNVVNPDDLIERFGADTLRLYEMFLGPIEQSKPWDTKGIEGSYRFINRFWGLFQTDNEDWVLSEEPADEEEKKLMNKCIQKVREDLERYSFNTAVSEFMKASNELRSKGCHKREILEPLVRAIAPFAPHMAEELWERMGYDGSVMDAPYPVPDESYLKEENVTYPVSFNGKTRFTMELPTDLSAEDIEKEVLASEKAAKYLQGQEPKKVIVVPNKIVNVVL